MVVSFLPHEVLAKHCDGLPIDCGVHWLCSALWKRHVQWRRRSGGLYWTNGLGICSGAGRKHLLPLTLEASIASFIQIEVAMCRLLIMIIEVMLLIHAIIRDHHTVSSACCSSITCILRYTLVLSTNISCTQCVALCLLAVSRLSVGQPHGSDYINGEFGSVGLSELLGIGRPDHLWL